MIRRSHLYTLLPLALSAAVVMAGRAGMFVKSPAAAAVTAEAGMGDGNSKALRNGRPGPRARGPAMIRTFAGRETFFTLQATSPDGLPLTIEWDFDGDGVFEEVTGESVARHTYRRGGRYKAVFRVTDIEGATDSDVIEVVVNEGSGAQEALQSLPAGPQAQATTGADGDPRFYVVMINGGSEERFWVDVDGFYQTLTGTYGIPDDDIFVLNYNGTDFYDGNPGGMIDYAATLDNVSLVFGQLAGMVDGDDTLLVWITDHGNGYAGEGYHDDVVVGYLGSDASVDPGDEMDYLESEFKLRSLFTGGDYVKNHGMDEWAVSKYWVSSMGAYLYYRHKYVSLVSGLELEDSTIVNDSDIFIEAVKDYLLGDTDRDGYIETSLGEVMDFDGDGVDPYDPDTGAYDLDDWGLPDTVTHYTHPNTQVPGGYPCLFDGGFDGRIDIDLNCPCPDYHQFPENCQTSLLVADGTDLDNQGRFDGLDVNEDGDLNDWVSIDEIVSLQVGTLSDDILRDHLATLNVGYVAVFMEPCYSGGFVEDLSSANRVIMTATMEEALSWGNTFVRNFTAAVDDPALSDVNGDGLVSMAEAFNYSALNDYANEIPQYDDNGDTLSTPFFIPGNGDGDLGNFLFIGSSPSCGNGLCEGPMGEDCSTCPADCPSNQEAICGDGVCNGSQYGETGETCPQDCPIDILPGGGTCGACWKGKCDGVCNSRKEDSSCADCNPPSGYNCGDGICDPGEDEVLCPVDCGTPPPVPGVCCGDDVCEGDETVADCFTDCACSGAADCAWVDDGNDCTLDTCVAGICQNVPIPDNTPCSIGVCNAGACEPVECSADADCGDGITCTTDACLNPGTIWAYCRSDWPECGLPDGCCGPSCGVEDPDCQATCDACWKGKCDGVCNDRKEGPDCADCQ